MDVDIDTELLAVTGNNSASDLDEESDIPEDDDDGVLEEEDDDHDDNERKQRNDDDEEEEYGIADEDYIDEDYSSTKKRKRSTARSSSSKSAKKPSSVSRKKSSSSSRKKSSREAGVSSSHGGKRAKTVDSEEEDDEVFGYEYDEQGYGDAKDYERLSQMNEVDREKLLTERQEKRRDAELIWKGKKKLQAKGTIKSMGGSGDGKSRKKRNLDDDNDREDDDDSVDIGDDDDDDDDDGNKYVHRSSRSSGRNRSSSKSDALDALAQDKRDKSARSNLDLGSDDESDDEVRGERKNKRKWRHDDGDYTVDDDDDDVNMDERLDDSDDMKKDYDRKKRESHSKKEENEIEEGEETEDPELSYKDIVTKSETGQAITTSLFLRREFLIQLSQYAYFERVVKGLFVRPKIRDAVDADGKTSSKNYLMCRVVGLHKGKPYDLMNSKGLRTNQYLVLQSGKQKKQFQINLMSGSHPTQQEFDVYIERSTLVGVDILRREEIKELIKLSQRYLYERNITATEEESKQHKLNMEVLYPARVNWTKKRTELEMDLSVKKQDMSSHKKKSGFDVELQSQIDDLELKIKTVRDMELKYNTHATGKSRPSDTQVFQSLGERNKRLNATNESLAASRRNFESKGSSIDLYSRFDATGQSYFSIGKDDAGGGGPLSEQAKDVYTGFDWRRNLISWNPDDAKKEQENGDSESAKKQSHAESLAALANLLGNNDRGIQVRKAVSSVPPGLDAMYMQLRKSSMGKGIAGGAPQVAKGARILSFEDWSAERAG